MTLTVVCSYLSIHESSKDIYCEPGSSVSIVSGYRLDDLAIEV
jgi:hypothetical protein